jgi:hypothetical protein
LKWTGPDPDPPTVVSVRDCPFLSPETVFVSIVRTVLVSTLVTELVSTPILNCFWAVPKEKKAGADTTIGENGSPAREAMTVQIAGALTPNFPSKISQFLPKT